MVRRPESECRSSEFSEGPRVVGLDGQTWTLPKIDMITTSKSQLLETYLRLDPIDVMVLGGTNFSERTRRLLIELLWMNYDVDYEHMTEIFGPEISNGFGNDVSVLINAIRVVHDAIDANNLVTCTLYSDANSN